MNKTNIEYLDYSWNPLAMRCTPISEGCEHCWHIKMADRLAKNPSLSSGQRNAYAGGLPMLLNERLNDPLKRKKPSIIGVQFMGDLFHKDVNRDWILQILMVVRKCPQHTFLVLTKRPQLMYDFSRYWFSEAEALADMTLQVKPIPQNLWPGITAENQQRADERIPILLQIPAAKRFVSIEPMLGWVDLAGDDGGQPYFPFDNEEGTVTPGLDWVIAGCESGPGRRPAKIEWFRDLKNQCQEADVPFFLKQLAQLFMFGHIQKTKVVKMPILDGQEWNERPE